MSLRYVQLMDALSYGDAVSNQAIRIHQILIEKGLQSEIVAQHYDPRVEKYVTNFCDFQVTENVVLMHHYSGYSEIADLLAGWRCYKIMIYHNITPAYFFDKTSSLYNHCLNGAEQFKNILLHYQLHLGDSAFNCADMEKLGATNTEVLPIIVPEFDHYDSTAILAGKLRGRNEHVWLFVGRISPNKRQDLLLNVFMEYRKQIGSMGHHLYLVGKYSADEPFYRQLSAKISGNNLGGSVTIVGEVSDEELPAYYKAADLFLCLSEHEGFCVPVVEAFNSSVPVVAYAGTAVQEKVVGGPGALPSLDLDQAVQRVHAVFNEPGLKEELIAHGLREAKKYSIEAVAAKIDILMDKFSSFPGKEQLLVSVVICTYNRHDYLARCLDYLKGQDYPHFEVIVVNGPSTDATAALLATRNDLKIVNNPRRNLSVSRNLGINKASGDIIAFIDDDALPFNSWLTEIVQRYRRALPNVVGVGGRTYYAGTLKFQFEDGIIDSFGNFTLVKADDQRIHDGRHYRIMVGTNCTFRRDALLAVGGFDEQYDYFHDESDLAVRLQNAGGVIAHAPSAYLRHEFAQSHNRLGKYSFNWYAIAKNCVYFAVKNGGHGFTRLQKALNAWSVIYNERCKVFLAAWRQGELSFAETLKYNRMALLGAVRGYLDSYPERRLGNDLAGDEAFLQYLNVSHGNKRIGGKQLHILIVSQEFPPGSYGGIGIYYQNLLKELLQMGHRVTVISRGKTDETITAGPYTHIMVGPDDAMSIWSNLPNISKNAAWCAHTAALIEMVHKVRPIDVIESALWDFEGVGALLVRDALKIPLVVRLVTPMLVAAETNGWEVNEDINLCAQMERHLVEQADAVIAISESIHKTFSTKYEIAPDSRWSVQLGGVQPWPSYCVLSNYSEFPADLIKGEVQVLFVGRLESRKGISVFMKALAIALPKDLRISVWIAGNDVEGWQKKAQGILQKKDLSRVQFMGVVDDSRKELLYAYTDFLVFPSRYESFGLVALEAMVHGTPVIGARAGAIPEVVLDGFCGLLFDAEDEMELAEKILLLADNKKLREQLAKNAKIRAEELSARNMAENSVSIYRTLGCDC